MKFLPYIALPLLSCGLLCQCSSDDDAAVPLGSIVAVDSEADTLIAQAAEQIAKGYPSKAIAPLREVLDEHPLAPNAAQARFMLGESYESLDTMRDAFKQYERVVKHYPSSPYYSKALNRQLAMAHAAAKGDIKGNVLWGLYKVDMEPSTVIEWLSSIIKNAPYNDMAAASSFILGQYLVDHDDIPEARLVYKKLVETYPTSKYAPSAQLMVAHLWADEHARGDQNMANLSRAEEAYEEFTLRYPNDSRAGKALQQASNVRSLMVEQELEVALYYLERANQYRAAVFCLEEVVRKRHLNPAAAKKAESLLPAARAHLSPQS